MLRLGILLSGRGSNFLAIADRVRSAELPAEIVIVISNRTDAAGIEAARKRGLKTVVIESRGRSREAHEREVISALREANVELICLAGYMRLLSPEFVRGFPDRILNIHPSLLPAFPGMDAQQQALDYGVKITGCTVHFVDEHLDHGPIVVQRAVEVREDDTVASLSARILAAEHVAYSEAIAKVVRGECEIDGRCVRLRSQSTRS